MFGVILVLIMVISANSIRCDHGLLWNDEFNGNDLDLKDWYIKSNDDICESELFFIIKFIMIKNFT